MLCLKKTKNKRKRVWDGSFKKKQKHLRQAKSSEILDNCLDLKERLIGMI